MGVSQIQIFCVCVEVYITASITALARRVCGLTGVIASRSLSGNVRYLASSRCNRCVLEFHQICTIGFGIVYSQRIIFSVFYLVLKLLFDSSPVAGWKCV